MRSADGTEIGYRSLGTGRGLVVVGGALSTGLDYLPLARLLSESYTVHLVDRRGRGLSGPQGAGHSLDIERDDLLAVAAATGASAVFGHSFGGVVALETARCREAFEQVVVYEPGVPTGGAVRFGWLNSYERRLARGDRRGAFACMVKGAGHAPAPLAIMPDWYVRSVLRLAVRGERWETISLLLESCLREHRLLEHLAGEVAADRYHTVSARVLLLAGAKSPSFAGRDLLARLDRALPRSKTMILDGLDHRAPEQRPDAVAVAIAEEIKPGPPVPARS